MKSWPTKPLGEVLEISRERIEPTEHPNTSFNYVGLESIEGHTGRLLQYQPTRGAEIKSTKNVFHRGEILYGKLRPYLNKVHLATEDGICSTDIYVLRPQQHQIHPTFVANYLRSPSVLGVVSNAMAGANLPRIGQESLLKIPVPVPPLADQERIAELLDEADELRKLRAQATSRTTALLPASFNEMFGDPATNPHKWRKTTLGELCELVNGAPFKPSDWDGSGLPIIRIQNLNDATKPFNYTSKRLPEKFRVRPGDILLSWSGTPGTSFGCFRWGGPEGWLNQHIFNVQLQPGLDGDFFIESVNVRLSEIIGKAHGGVGLQHITKGTLNEVEMLVPPLALQKDFAQRVTEIRELEASQDTSRTRLDTLFQSMLHRAFNGEL
jgi:type I restriction enzyme, S subunit